MADVETRNGRSQPVDLFCGSGGARLYVRGGEGFDPVEHLYRVVGNDTICSNGLQPGESATVHLPFRVPAGDRARRLDLWNAAAAGDILGTRTRVRVEG